MGTIALNTTMFYSPVMNLVHEAGDKRAGHDLLRESIFFRLLSYSADNFNFLDSDHFAKIARVPSAQAKLVWDVCQNLGVLRPLGEGFSALDWLVDNHLFLQKKASKSKIEGSYESETMQEKKSETSTTKSESVVAKPERITIEREIKEQVRPNVRLSRKEINSLREQFSDEEIAKMLDKLSTYKSNSGRTYSSDYQAIIKWVHKAIQEPKVFPTKQPESFELPDWMLGSGA